MKAPKTARLAVEQGYSNVYLYREGLSGWSKKGFATASVDKIPSVKIDLLTPDQVNERITENPSTVLLDLRDDDLYGSLRFRGPDVLHVRMVDLIDRMSSLPRDREIIVACHLGKQGMKAAPYLKSKGYDNVIGVMVGGIMAWQKAGLPVER